MNQVFANSRVDHGVNQLIKNLRTKKPHIGPVKGKEDSHWKDNNAITKSTGNKTKMFDRYNNYI